MRHICEKLEGQLRDKLSADVPRSPKKWAFYEIEAIVDSRRPPREGLGWIFKGPLYSRLTKEVRHEFRKEL